MIPLPVPFLILVLVVGSVHCLVIYTRMAQISVAVLY